jgi:hypothetical protein
MFYHKSKGANKVESPVPKILPKVLSLTLTEEILGNYKTDVFVETGTYNGGGVQIALDVGFPKIYSVEMSDYFYEYCCKKFSKNDNVKLFHGTSEEYLPEIIKGIHTKITFWLDAHEFGGGKSSLYNELAIIAEHPLKNHNILIDDRKYFHTWKVEESVVIDKVKAINKDYQIIVETNSRMDGNSMLIATCK